MKPSLKLTEEVAADIRARVKALDFGTIEKIKKAKEDNGSFDVIISTEDLDRAGEIVRQDGWEMANYKNNPIVLWGHDYYNLPIGVCTETYKTEVHGVPATGARGIFLSADINPLAQQIRRMYDLGVKSGMGVGCTTSVGFIPKEFDESNQRIITKAELLEFSFVPIPANQGVGPAQGRALTFAEAKTLKLDTTILSAKGLTFAETFGLIPKELADKKAPEKTSWKKPTLKDFTDKDWKDLSGAEKRAIEGHFAYLKAEGPEPHTFDDLKLPYRRASDGAIVLNGLKEAMGGIVAAVEVEGDRKAVYDHLAGFYKLFNKDAPDFTTLKAAEAGDSCTTEDGTPGVLSADPNDPDGAMVCIPQESDKSAKDVGDGQKKLVKAISDEHERHGNEVEDSFADFRKKAPGIAEDQGDPEDADKPDKKGEKGPAIMREAVKDLRDSLRDEHDMHRAKSLAIFRSFETSNDKAFDRKSHVKALREQHEAYESKNKKALDEFEEKCMKSVQGEPGSTDEHTDWVTGKMEENGRVHKKAVVKIAKAMCKAAYGEEEEADEKTIEILKEFLSPHIDAQLLPALTGKIGARISASTKEKIAEAHEHLKAAKTVLEGLHGGLADGNEEESRSDDAKSAGDGSRENRSKPRTTSRSEDPALKAHLQAREIVGGIEAAARNALGKINAEIRDRSRT